MIIPKSTDSWLVLGPGRTGSRHIADIIERVYKLSKIPLMFSGPTNNHLLNGEKIADGQIVHEHDVNLLHLASKNTRIVLSKRNIFESALSWSVVHHRPSFHTRRIGYTTIAPKPFILSEDVFFEHFKNAYDHYQEIDKLKPHIDFFEIDYNDIDEKKVIDILQLQVPDSNFVYSRYIKNRDRPEDWLINYNQIFEFMKKLKDEYQVEIPKQLSKKFKMKITKNLKPNGKL